MLLCFPFPDRNECEEGVQCRENSNCVNGEGSFRCVCQPGFEDIDGSCVNINQCANGMHDCHANATCIDIPGLFECRCDPGFMSKLSF